MDKKYRLKVTAGPTWDPSTHQVVPVNADETLRIENEHCVVDLCVRIQDYAGYPHGSPKTNAYFSHPEHVSDQYSIATSVVFKQPTNSDEVVFGNYFGHPIRDKLPPGFTSALRLVKWMLDPALDGDPYADKPYLCSPAVATWNKFCIGDVVNKIDKAPPLHNLVIEEVDEGSGAQVRKKHDIPSDVDGRRKHFHNEENRKSFNFEKGRVYFSDFGNPYLGFSDFTLRLPGFHLHVTNYIDEKNHKLRYILKNRATDDIYFVVVFELVHRSKEDEALSFGQGEQADRMKNGGKSNNLERGAEASTSDIE
ncbi:hypothetical protein ASPZODRAFT_151511 [Penicilliopsis zonata CBS 506.65]|uniref:Domain of unknown function at the cortex 1 domain-containing protein n=1 Tax=Penicilliopsis zonata CBS 506.65 TaxID=1073090 RepID=A0A1L9SI61_9EURO|nr:hypothetical protein ASPZODRAFT_151511 [Penicilliopsis zonata CBS 506.65]OJJ46912.1 hypothetical protein ASPZODRAFT_151511 [Penicilliopsis zonata CBS 506.65]